MPFRYLEFGEAHGQWPSAYALPPPIADHIRITSQDHDLTIDELRISDIPRYEYDAAFTPPGQPYAPDAHTLLLMHLDGNLKPVE